MHVDMIYNTKHYKWVYQCSQLKHYAYFIQLKYYVSTIVHFIK